MAQVKCTECNQIFDGTLNECPNCGCPTNECEPLVTKTDETKGVTTDTGYKYEEQLISYVNILYWSLIIAGGIMSIVTMIFLSSLGVNGFLLGLLLSIMIFMLCYGIATITKAILMIMPNMSINVHEINMKLK